MVQWVHSQALTPASGAELCEDRRQPDRLLPSTSMPRIPLFELHEQYWMPSIIRDSVVECLYNILRRRRTVSGMVDPLQEFLRRSGATRILDLCSGAGGSALIFAEELRKRETKPPAITLSDLFPRAEAWQAARDELSVNVDYWPESVDATEVAPELAGGCARMINNALHHFPPEAAQAIFKDAVDNSAGIFIGEVYPRSLLQFAHFACITLPIVFGLPFLTSRHKLQKAVLTWLVPVISCSILWDGLVSTLRMYTEAELRQLVAPLGNRFEWVYGTCRYWPAGTATYFYGVPRSG